MSDTNASLHRQAGKLAAARKAQIRAQNGAQRTIELNPWKGNKTSQGVSLISAIKGARGDPPENPPKVWVGWALETPGKTCGGAGRPLAAASHF